jgi:hypothetical protein
MAMKVRCLSSFLCRSLGWLGFGTGVLAGMPAHAQGPVPDPMIAEIRMLDEGEEMCLDVPDGNNADQLRLQMFPCHGLPNQRWLLRFDFSGFVIVESESTHKCLDTPTTTIVQQFRCHGGDNQRWQLFADPETLRFRLRPKLARDRCLHVAADRRMDLVACDPTIGAVRLNRARWERENFEFRLQRPAGETDPVINEDRQWCLDVANASQSDGAVVQTHACNGGGSNQTWRLIQQTDGFFFLEADHSRKCVRRTGTNVDQATCDRNQDRHKWFPQLTSTGRVKLQTKQPACHLIPGPNDPSPRDSCECLNAQPNSQTLSVTRCTTSADFWRLGTGRFAPGALTFFEDNGVQGDRLCGLPPAAGEYRFEQPGAHACDDDEASSLLLFEIAAGTEIEVFDDDLCRTSDDHTLIRVKRSVVRYELGSFERGFEDEFLKVDRLTSGDLDGEVSCVRIRTP